MANINDFKLIKKKCLNRYGFIRNIKNEPKSELEKEKIGFYHLILEGITGVIEHDDPRYTIIDTEYNKIVNDLGVDDLGMDMVFISEMMDSENKEIDIKLFNFKYRSKFNPDKTKSDGDISRSTKFLEYIISGSKQDETKNSLVSKEVNKIIDLLDSNAICNLTLYMVSNEAKGFEDSSNKYIELLESSYGMKVLNVSLDEITSFYSGKKSVHSSKFSISGNDFLSFESDEKSTQKSYIIKLSLLDLIRICSDNIDLTQNYLLEDDSVLANASLDFSLLYDNVRGFLGETKYNKNILTTLRENHLKFFTYNNGITITAEKIDCDPYNSGKKYLVNIENFQVVNGGQTIRSIFNFLDECKDENDLVKLREAYALVRIFKTSKDDVLKNSIAEYTNSQNSISDVDLKSIDPLQIQIESYLGEYDILYTRKAGDLGSAEKTYTSRISMEKMAQLLYSVLGYPDRASNQKARLFQDYYNKIFKDDNFSIDKCKDMVELSENIIKTYEFNKKYKYYDQKLFYVAFITQYTSLSIEEATDKLEELIRIFVTDKELSDSRKLLQKRFKAHVCNELGISFGE